MNYCDNSLCLLNLLRISFHRELCIQDALKAAEHASEDTNALLINCRGEKNAVKTILLEQEIENDKLQIEYHELQKRLKKQTQDAKENINNLIKEMKEKDKDLEQSRLINDRLTKKLEEIERKCIELPIRYLFCKHQK